MWQKLPYICNNFFYYNNLSITFLNYCTIEKSPWSNRHFHEIVIFDWKSWRIKLVTWISDTEVGKIIMDLGQHVGLGQGVQSQLYPARHEREGRRSKIDVKLAPSWELQLPISGHGTDSTLPFTTYPSKKWLCALIALRHTVLPMVPLLGLVGISITVKGLNVCVFF